MSDKVYLGPRVSNLDTGEPAARISRVNLVVDSEHMYTAGDDSGRTIEKVCPWGTQAMANSILASLRDVEYRPYSGLDGLLDPAAEVGDGITVGGMYSVLACTDILFDRLGTADVSAPGGDEVEDEYPYKSRARRQSDRALARVYSTITKTSERITLLVANEVEQLEGKIELTATSLTTQITNTREGLSSKIEQTASSLSSEISNTKDGLNSKIEQTASSLSTRISNAQGDIASLQQTANSLIFTANAQGSSISSLWDAVNGFSLEVSNGAQSSTLYLMSGRTELSSAEIVLRGAVTFEDLAYTGRTVINGGNITTGTIDAEKVNVSGAFGLYLHQQMVGYVGAGEGYDGNKSTYGAMLSDYTFRSYFLASNAGVRMTDGSGAIWVTNGNCFSSTDMMTYSDRRMKADIDYDLECYKKFFRALRPCRFLLLANPMEGYHTGFVAQEVESAMDAANLSPMDFAGLGRVRLPDGTNGYALRYGAFAALNTYMIQDLERRVAALEGSLK